MALDVADLLWALLTVGSSEGMYYGDLLPGPSGRPSWRTLNCGVFRASVKLGTGLHGGTSWRQRMWDFLSLRNPGITV